MNYLADKSFLCIKPQADPGTVVIPTIHLPLVSEGIKVNNNFAADRRMKGLDWKSDDIIQAMRSISGPLSVWADPDTLGHILNMCMTKGVTTGDDSNGYTHPFTPGDGDSYVIEIPRGDFAQRFWGCRGDNLGLKFEDGKLMASLDIKGIGQFSAARLAVALTGAGMTSATFKTDYDPRPTDGLVAGDVIRIGSTNITITSITNATTIAFASTSVTASVGDSVFLLAQTPSLSTLSQPFFLRSTLVGVGDDTTEADTNAASRTLASECYDIELAYKNNLLETPASGSFGASSILNRVKEAGLTLSRLFETPEQHNKWLQRVKQAITIIATGDFIKTDFSTSELLTIKLHKVKLINNDEPLDIGEYIFDKQTFEALYDSSDAESIEIELVNKSAGTVY